MAGTNSLPGMKGNFPPRPKSTGNGPFREGNLVRRLLQGQPIERVPLFPHASAFCARNVGYPLAAIYNDPGKSFEAQLWTFEQYGFDWGPIYGFASYGTWEIGEHGESPALPGCQGVPPHRMFPVQSEEALDRLQLPDPRSAGHIPQAMEFSKLQLIMGTPISVVLGGNFTIAANICPVETLCRWMLKKSELVHRVLRLATDHLIDIVRLWVGTFGVKDFFPHIHESLASNRILSPRQFEQFIFPYLKESSEKILSMGVKHIFYHICGEQRLNLPFWSKVPMGDPGICGFGSEVDLDLAVQYLGPTSIIAGNIDPRMILRGSPFEVYDLCRKAIEKGKKAPRGFMLMSGCEIPPDSPPYNVYVMRKAIDDHGGIGRK